MKIKDILKNKKILLILNIVIIIIVISVLILIIMNSKNKNNIETLSEIHDENIIDNSSDDNSILDNTEITEEDKEEIEKANNTKKDEKNNPNNISSNTSYYIKVNNLVNVVTVYQKDNNGNFQPIKAMTCSTGTATPKSGVYTTKIKWVWGKLFGNVYGHYVTKIVGNILFHSVPYTTQSPSSLEYWEYDKLGTSASMGCVRLCVIDSKWIFDNIPSGTSVEFYSDSNPGPLGKPSTKQISSVVECRNWDPTDPDRNNPWHNYKASTQNITPVQTPTNTIINNDSQTKIENKTNTVEKENTNKNETKNNTVTNSNIISDENIIND